MRGDYYYVFSSLGPCCTKECKTADEKTICEFGNDCIESTKCPSSQERIKNNIIHYKCPSPKFRPNGTECQGGALLCHNGLCSKSVCTKYDLKPCECKNKKEECHACCIDNGVCRSAYKIEKVYVQTSGITLKYWQSQPDSLVMLCKYFLVY